MAVNGRDILIGSMGAMRTIFSHTRRSKGCWRNANPLCSKLGKLLDGSIAVCKKHSLSGEDTSTSNQKNDLIKEPFIFLDMKHGRIGCKVEWHVAVEFTILIRHKVFNEDASPQTLYAIICDRAIRNFRLGKLYLREQASMPYDTAEIVHMNHMVNFAWKIAHVMPLYFLC